MILLIQSTTTRGGSTRSSLHFWSINKSKCSTIPTSSKVLMLRKCTARSWFTHTMTDKKSEHIEELFWFDSNHKSWLSTHLWLDDLDQEQDVIHGFGEQGHLTALVQKCLLRWLQTSQQLAPKQSQFPKKGRIHFLLSLWSVWGKYR